VRKPDASITDLFLALVAVPSPSGRERAVGELIRDWLTTAGVAAEFDATGDQNDSDAGNLLATVPGADGAPTYLFVAHMDTVESGATTVQPRLDAHGVVRSDGETILGADNKSAVAAVMCACRAAIRLPVDRRPTVVAAFTSREESGRMGASLLDLSDRRIDCAFCVDGSKPVGTVITRALGQTVFTITVHGRAAHAAANPEAGLNAIKVAAEIIASLRLGRQAHGGSLSIAAIAGGAIVDRLHPRALAALGVEADADGPAFVRAALAATPTNSVPDIAYFRGEARGYSTAEIEQTIDAIVDVVTRVCDRHGAEYEWTRDLQRMIPPMPGRDHSRAFALFAQAAAGIPGVKLIEEQAQATLEANYLAARSDVVAVASGGRDPHQTSESITVAELDQLEALLIRIVELGVLPEL
jgi:acetylornithine deacetylase/succinyl-diaminopimelate desuccinylase-like protein